MSEGKMKLVDVVATDGASATLAKIGKNLDGMTSKLERQLKQTQLTAKGFDLYEAELNGATQAQLTHIASIHDAIEATKRATAVELAHGEAMAMAARMAKQQAASLGGVSAAKTRFASVTDIATARTKKMGKEVDNTKQKLRFMRGGLGQVGYQVQDIAVQLQMGQNAMLVFGQQGSQIASLFGPGGAIIGALLAVGAAVATYFMPGFNDANAAMKKTRDATDALIDSYDELTGILKAEAFRQASKQISTFRDQIRDSKVLVAELTAEMKRQLDLNAQSLSFESGEAARNDLLRQRTEINADFNRKLSEQVVIQAVAAKQIDTLTGKVDNRTNATVSLIDKLKDEERALTLTAAEMLEYELTTNKATEADSILTREIWSNIQALKAQAKAVEDAAKAAEDAQRAKEKLAEDAKKAEADRVKGVNTGFERAVEQTSQALETPAQKLARELSDKQAVAAEYEALDVANKAAADQLRLDAMAVYNSKVAALDAEALDNKTKNAKAADAVLLTQFSNLASFYDEGSAIGKAFYVAQQGIAAATAVMQGLAAAQAIRLAYAQMAAVSGPLAPKILATGEAHAGAAVTMGALTAAAIAGQTIGSFEGGGSTGRGSRSGGMDSKGGFLAMLHPNETVIDHTKGSGGVTIVNNIDATGAGADVEAKIRRAVDQSGAQTIATIQDLMRRRRFV